MSLINNKKGPLYDPGTCRCCGASKKCRVLNEEYEYQNQKETYSDLFVECFGLVLSHLDGEPSDRLICATCVNRLREASSFRRQVLQCEEKLLQSRIHLHDEGTCGSLPIKIKTELIVKEENVEEDCMDHSDNVDSASNTGVAGFQTWCNEPGPSFHQSKLANAIPNALDTHVSQRSIAGSKRPCNEGAAQPEAENSLGQEGQPERRRVRRAALQPKTTHIMQQTISDDIRNTNHTDTMSECTVADLKRPYNEEVVYSAEIMSCQGEEDQPECNRLNRRARSADLQPKATHIIPQTIEDAIPNTNQTDSMSQWIIADLQRLRKEVAVKRAEIISSQRPEFSRLNKRARSADLQSKATQIMPQTIADPILNINPTDKVSKWIIADLKRLRKEVALARKAARIKSAQGHEGRPESIQPNRRERTAALQPKTSHIMPQTIADSFPTTNHSDTMSECTIASPKRLCKEGTVKPKSSPEQESQSESSGPNRRKMTHIVQQTIADAIPSTNHADKSQWSLHGPKRPCKEETVKPEEIISSQGEEGPESRRPNRCERKAALQPKATHKEQPIIVAAAKTQPEPVPLSSEKGKAQVEMVSLPTPLPSAFACPVPSSSRLDAVTSKPKRKKPSGAQRRRLKRILEAVKKEETEIADDPKDKEIEASSELTLLDETQYPRAEDTCMQGDIWQGPESRRPNRCERKAALQPKATHKEQPITVAAAKRQPEPVPCSSEKGKAQVEMVSLPTPLPSAFACPVSSSSGLDAVTSKPKRKKPSGAQLRRLKKILRAVYKEETGIVDDPKDKEIEASSELTLLGENQYPRAEDTCMEGDIWQGPEFRRPNRCERKAALQPKATHKEQPITVAAAKTQPEPVPLSSEKGKAQGEMVSLPTPLPSAFASPVPSSSGLDAVTSKPKRKKPSGAQLRRLKRILEAGKKEGTGIVHNPKDKEIEASSELTPLDDTQYPRTEDTCMEGDIWQWMMRYATSRSGLNLSTEQLDKEAYGDFH